MFANKTQSKPHRGAFKSTPREMTMYNKLQWPHLIAITNYSQNEQSLSHPDLAKLMNFNYKSR
ncbi:MAG: hypothetical protein ACKO96_42610 [Flammeovirgaceae bacterium]